MSKIKKLILLFSGLIYFNIVNAQEGYLCVSEAAGGVSFDQTQKKWKGTTFRNSNEKILIYKKNNQWTMKKFASTVENKCTSPNEYGFMFCDIFGGELKLSIKSGRYMSTYIVGYIDGKDNDENTPHIEIGVCTAL